MACLTAEMQCKSQDKMCTFLLKSASDGCWPCCRAGVGSDAAQAGSVCQPVKKPLEAVGPWTPSSVIPRHISHVTSAFWLGSEAWSTCTQGSDPSHSWSKWGKQCDHSDKQELEGGAAAQDKLGSSALLPPTQHYHPLLVSNTDFWYSTHLWVLILYTLTRYTLTSKFDMEGIGC